MVKSVKSKHPYLSGKIIWIMDDFSYWGVNISAKDSTVHIVSRLDKIVIDENIIKLQTEPSEGNPAYHINLFINLRGTHYEGTVSMVEDIDINGKASCELFENENGYFLYGKWVEDEVYYTWWSRIDKNKNLG